MILYSSSVDKFIDDIKKNRISMILNNAMKEHLYHHTSDSERTSWENSLEYMSRAIIDSKIPNNCTIVLEYNLPISSSRIDFIITGYDYIGKDKILLFELKQWTNVNEVENSDILVETFVGNGLKKVVHPAYQALTYKDLLCDYNKYIQENGVNVIPAVVMHNYSKNGIVNSSIFSNFIDSVNMFYKEDYNQLVSFIKNSFFSGDNCKIVKKIEDSDFCPSKKLQDTICNLMFENNTFTLLDNQMVVFEQLLSDIDSDKKTVSIVEGNPGTGKSVLAINILAELIKNGKMAQYVSRNTAPRVVYSSNLKGTINKNNIDNLFKTSGSYTSVSNELFDCLIVDEAHCLTEKSGLFNNYGVNQIKELIESSKHTVFFIDEKQKVHFNDIGTIKEIEFWARTCSREIKKYSLTSQFRCNGSNNYLAFVDYFLGIEEDFTGFLGDYDIAVCDSPNELRKIIENKNNQYQSRVLAGYCWNWNKKEADNSNYHDIKINDFEMSWNLGTKQTYAIDNSIGEVGCIHSVQGLEFDYVGVIIGPDLLYEDGKVITNFHHHASTDPSFKGIKTLEKKDPEYANKIADTLIKNTYRVLLTRGIKGCYVYCVDDKLNNYLRELLKNGIKPSMPN